MSKLQQIYINDSSTTIIYNVITHSPSFTHTSTTKRTRQQALKESFVINYKQGLHFSPECRSVGVENINVTAKPVPSSYQTLNNAVLLV